MNEYEFEIECDDGHLITYRTFAVNKLMAYGELTQYLVDCEIDPETVRIVAVYVDTKEN